MEPMNDPIDENAEHEPREEAETNDPTANSDPLADLKDRASDMLRGRVTDVRESIEEQIPNIREDLTRGLGEASYGIGYALNFASTLLKEFAPDDLNEGYEKGADAGGKAAEVVVKDRHERRAATEEVVPEDVEPEPNPG